MSIVETEAYLSDGSAPCCSSRRTTAPLLDCDATWSNVVDSWRQSSSRDTPLGILPPLTDTCPPADRHSADTRVSWASVRICWMVNTSFVLQAAYSALYTASSQHTTHTHTHKYTHTHTCTHTRDTFTLQLYRLHTNTCTRHHLDTHTHARKAQ